ncbi:predicted protein [Postia placenta Mad-698-R]|nr:predicted protein [Postia placenta Mad-698-R]
MWYQLRKSDSLPFLRLKPNGQYFESARPRRRISAPQLLSEAQKAQLVRIDHKSTAVKQVRISPIGPRAGASAQRGVLFDDSGDVARWRTSRSSKTIRRRNRLAAVYSVQDIVATTTTDSKLEPFLRELVDMLEQGSASPAPSLPLHDSTQPTTSSAYEDTDVATMDEKENRFVSNTMTPRTLRRKQRIGIPRQHSSRSMRKRSAASLCKGSSKCLDATRAPVTTPIVLSSSPNPSSSPSPSPQPRPKPQAAHIPLGHPQRPLYSAIRKNMARPSIPDTIIPKMDLPSLHAQVCELARETCSLDVPFGRTFDLAPATAAGCGWTWGSAGEAGIDMRAELARCRSADSVGDFAYDGKRGGAVKEKVRSLGKGLRGLLLGRA